MEMTEFSETSVSKNLTPGKYPKESNLHEGSKTTQIMMAFVRCGTA
jgi:hypothetical protein